MGDRLAIAAAGTISPGMRGDNHMGTNLNVSANGSSGGGAAGGTYGLGLIGALVYYIGSADSFLDGLWGVFQALFWPAFLVWELLDFLGA
jgi:hypothetical protein